MLSSTVVMFQARNRETINSTWNVALSFKIIMTTSVTRPCFTTQHQTCKTKTKTDFLVWDRFCLKTDSLRPHHWRSCWKVRGVSYISIVVSNQAWLRQQRSCSVCAMLSKWSVDGCGKPREDRTGARKMWRQWPGMSTSSATVSST